MSLFGDLKKIFFGAKSVTKSAADKAVDAGKEATTKLSENAEDLFDQVKDTSKEMRSKVIE